MTEIELLEDRIKIIDRRSAEIEARVTRLNKPGDYEVQELQTEQNVLAGHRAVAAAQLRELRGDFDQAERARKAAALARRDALRAARTKAIERQCYVTAEHFEQLRDYRSARNWRLQALDARRQAEWEIH